MRIVPHTSLAVFKPNQYVFIDTETELITHHSHTPDLVYTVYTTDGINFIEVSNELIPSFLKTLSEFKCKLVFHNASFDIGVFLKQAPTWDIWGLYDENLIYDTQIMFKLLYIAENGYTPFKSSLSYCHDALYGTTLDKSDELRLNWGQYKHECISKIPQNLKEYCAKDVEATYNVFWGLLPQIQAFSPIQLLSYHIQAKGDFALDRVYKRGIAFDLERATEWLKTQDVIIDRLSKRLALFGYVRGMKGNQVFLEKALKMLGVFDQLPKTETGEPSTAEEDLRKFKHIPFVNDFLTLKEYEKDTSFIRDIETHRIHPRYDSIKNTCRTSCKNPNIQKLPRSGDIRSFFIADKDEHLISADYSAIELATLSQHCYTTYKQSKMREVINSGVDLHKYMASKMTGKDIKDITKIERQGAKALNFGLPGGLGSDTFVEYAKTTYGVEFTKKEAIQLKQTWIDTFPEMELHVNGQSKGYSKCITGFIRGNVRYTAERNTPFQHLAACGAKLALYRCEKEGLKVVAFVHDSISISSGNIEKDKIQLENIMIEEMRKVTPDVEIRVETNISTSLGK